MVDLIAKPFNLTMLGILLVNGLVIFLLWYFLRQKSETTRRNALLISSGILIIIYCIHRVIIFNDIRFLTLYGQNGFILRDTLPLHLCEIGMILIPISLLTKNEVLSSFCFVITPLGAALAIIYPAAPWDVTPIYDPIYIGYYLEHAFCIINGISLVTLGLFQPQMRLLGKTAVMIVAMTTLAHLINLGGALLGFEGVNYFYTVDPSGSFLLEIFYSLIPYKFWYMLFGIPISCIYYILLIGSMTLWSKRFGQPELESLEQI